MTRNITPLLREILNPKLLLQIHEKAIPPPGSSAEELFRRFYGDGGQEIATELYAIAFHQALVPLSQIPLNSYPKRLLTLLHDPHEVQFPVYALGLILLLDQVTRLILKGYNARWTAGFFDILAFRLATELDDLPGSLRPHNIGRWSGYDWNDAALRTTFFTLPLLHNDTDESNVARSFQLTEYTRQSAELHFHREDPARTNPQARKDESDSFALPRLVGGSNRIPPPYYAKGSFDDYLFFDCQTNRAHMPVIDQFGRYPWRSALLGRVNTAEETQFLDDIGDFAKIDPGVANDIRDDVQNKIWRPLKDNVPSGPALQTSMGRVDLAV